MTRGGTASAGDEPERRCIATGQSGPKAALVRFVVGPDGVVWPDVGARLPGRGLWVTAERAALDRAVAKGLFSRAAKQAVQVPPDLVAQVEAALVRRLVGHLALARKAGAAVAGYEKVREWLMSGRAAVLVQAADGSERGRAKLRPPAAGEGAGTTLIDCLTAGEIGLAFGREHVIHAALAAGGLGARALEDAARLAGVRGRIGGDAAGKE